MGRAMRLIERVPSVVPIATRVDGIYFAARTAAATAELNALAFGHTHSISQRNIFQIKAARKAKAKEVGNVTSSFQARD